MKALVILMSVMFASSSGRSPLDFLRKSKPIFNEFAEKAPELLQEIGELFFDPDIYKNITSCFSKKFPPSSTTVETILTDGFDASYECT